ncbi:MAG: hypothetical protein K2H61_00460 [Muribaculaceae bacterium]|nr:hypothetical protein [Muribaculaceae bacterium]
MPLRREHPLELIKRFTRNDPELQQRISELMIEVNFKRGDRITGQSQLSRSAFYILKGAARVCYMRKEKENTFSFAFENEFVMLSRRLLSEADSTLSIEFLEPTTVLTMKMEAIGDELERSGKVEFTAATVFLNAALHNVALYLEERLLQFQKASARERFDWAISRYPRLLDVATGTQLASFLGIAKETLYRLRADSYPG